MTQALITTDSIDITPEIFSSNLKRVVALQGIIKKSFVAGKDYGTIPGCGNKPTLLKPGAEKIQMIFGLTADYEIIDMTQDYNNLGFFSYVVKCVLYHNGIKINCGLGQANSKETKFAYKWVYESELPSNLDKSKLISKKGKYRVPENCCDKANTILKIAKKRALVDSTLSIAGLSELFTQDFDDDDLPTPQDKVTEVKEKLKAEAKTVNNTTFECSVCGKIINKTTYDYSTKKYKKALCYNCQRKV